MDWESNSFLFLSLDDSDDTVEFNQLKKYDGDVISTDVRRVLEEWYGQENASVWVSHTLAADIGLPMSTAPLPDTVQLLVLATHLPLLLVTLYDESKIDQTRARRYSIEMSQCLTPSLHRFCAEDFASLACAMPLKGFSIGKLEEEIEQRRDILDGFYGGPIDVSRAAYKELRKAVMLAASTSGIPHHLDPTHFNPNRVRQLMHAKNRLKTNISWKNKKIIVIIIIVIIIIMDTYLCQETEYCPEWHQITDKRRELDGFIVDRHRLKE